MKRALVTGADGFIGSHLTEALLADGYKVRALALYNSFNYWGWLEEIPENRNLEVVTGDIRDPHFVKMISKDIDIIFHLAALIAIPYSYCAPDTYIETNIKGTLNVCQAAKELGGVRTLITSTSEVYGTALYVPIDEKHPKQAQSPYSASKIGADALALSFYNAYNLPVTIVRPFNTYGPRQSARAIIPTIISQIASGNSQIKVGDLSPTRDLNFVKDTIRGFMSISEADQLIGEEVNIASNYEISMKEVCDIIKVIMKREVEVVYDQLRFRPNNSEVYRLWGDNTLIRSHTSWEPTYDLENGLRETCDWFTNKLNLSKYKSHIYNI